jgi:hypothetical protein
VSWGALAWGLLALSLAMSTTALLFALRRVEDRQRAQNEAEERREAVQEEYMPGQARREAPLPMDPDNPPKLKRYTGPDGRYRCHCHELEIKNGDEILIWPRPDQGNGARSLFCARFVKEQHQ